MCDSTPLFDRAQVRNISDGQFDLANPKHWYCGRWAKYRRPGQPDLSNPYRIGVRGTREDVIALYRQWLWQQMQHSRTVRHWLR